MPNGLALAIVLLVIMLFMAYLVSLLLNFLTPFYTTPLKSIKNILDILNLKPTDSFVDLGSGDGRMVFGLHKRFKCKSVGYEISPMLLLYFKLKKFFLFPFNRKIQLKEESFFNADLKDYDVVYCCLPTDILILLEKKFERELKKGTTVVTYKNALPNKKGKKILIGNTQVYQYTF